MLFIQSTISSEHHQSSYQAFNFDIMPSLSKFQQAETEVCALYGHSHMRRLFQLLQDGDALKEFNATRQARKSVATPLLPDLGLGMQLEFQGNEGATTDQLSVNLEANESLRRQIQVIFIGDNERKHLSGVKYMASKIYRSAQAGFRKKSIESSWSSDKE